jgi:lipopolysaccharide export system permease protein
MWVLKTGQIIERDETGSFISKPFKVFTQRFPETPDDFLVPEYESAEKSLTGLFSDISKQDLAIEKTRARAEFYGRISYLLLGIPLLLLGLPILIISYQKWGRDLSIAIPVSCFMAFFAWGIWGTLQSLAKAGTLWPIPAAFSVNIVFALIGLYLLKKQDL